MKFSKFCCRWVKEEISGFGGNPGNVCLFGESSGSGMVHLLMFSPLSAGLFHKAILQSGACLSPCMLSAMKQDSVNSEE